MAFEVARAAHSEVKMMPKILETLFAKAPQMADRCNDFSADRGLDNAPQKKLLCGQPPMLITPARRSAAGDGASGSRDRAGVTRSRRSALDFDRPINEAYMIHRLRPLAGHTSGC